jgi:hypothetical protein
MICFFFKSHIDGDEPLDLIEFIFGKFIYNYIRNT